MIQEKLNKKETKATSFFIMIMILLSAIGANAPSIEISGLGNLYLFRLMTPVLLLFFFKKNFYKNSIMSDTIILFTVWFLCGLISLIWTFDINNSLSGLFNYLVCFVWVIWLLGTIKTKEIFHQTIIFIAVVIILCCGLGVFEAVTGKYFFRVQEGIEQVITGAKFHYPVVFFFNPNDFMFFIIGIIPFMFYVIKEKIASKLVRIVMYAAYLALSCFMLWLADCRMGFVVLPIMFIVWFFTTNWKKRWPLAALALMICVLFVVIKPSILEKIAQESRLQIWQDALTNFMHSNFLGTGIGNANYHLENVKYKSELTATHFWFLQIFVELGLFFTFIFAIWLYTIFRRGLNMVKYKDNNYSPLGKAVLVFLIALFPMSMMSSSLAVSPIFWTYVALLLLAVSVKLSEKEARNE